MDFSLGEVVNLKPEVEAQLRNKPIGTDLRVVATFNRQTIGRFSMETTVQVTDSIRQYFEFNSDHLVPARRPDPKTFHVGDLVKNKSLLYAGRAGKSIPVAENHIWEVVGVHSDPFDMLTLRLNSKPSGEVILDSLTYSYGSAHFLPFSGRQKKVPLPKLTLKDMSNDI